MSGYWVSRLVQKMGLALAVLTLLLVPLPATAGESSARPGGGPWTAHALRGAIWLPRDPAGLSPERLAAPGDARQNPTPMPAGPPPTSPVPTPRPTLDPHATAVPAPVATQWATAGRPTPVVAGTPTATAQPGGVVPSITRAFYTILFPVESLEDALRGVMSRFLSGSTAAAEAVFAEAVDAIVFSALQDEEPAVRAPWTGMLKLSAALWPLTFVIVLAGAARESLSSSAPVGFAETKHGLLDWLISVALAAGSLAILTSVGALFREVTRTVLVADWGVLRSLDAHAIAGTLLNSAILGGLTALSPFGGMLVAFFFIILALSVLISLVLVTVARSTLLFILIALAPLVLTIGVLPPTRWLNWTWTRMVLLASLLGPANALLLKLASLAAIQQAGAMGELSLMAAVVHFFKLLGVLSLLLTLNYTVAKTTFGAVNEVKDRAVGATRQVAGMVVTAAAVGAAALGGAAIGAGGLAAGTAAGGGGAGAAAGAAGSGTLAQAGATASAGSQAMRSAVAQMGASAASRPPGPAGSGSPSGQSGAGLTSGPGATRHSPAPGAGGIQAGTATSNSPGETAPNAGAPSGTLPAGSPDSPANASGQPPAATGGATARPAGREAGTRGARSLAGALQVGGASLSTMSGSRLGRGTGTAARVAGWMMERQIDRESRAGPAGREDSAAGTRQSGRGGWSDLASGLGALSPAGAASVTSPLARLAEQYGAGAVRSAAGEALGPAVAAHQFAGESAPSMAIQDGFYTRDAAGQPQADISAWIGATVENRLRTMPGGSRSGPRLYPAGPPSAPAATHGVDLAPSPVDYRQGAQMAEALGYGPGDQEALRGLAALHHLHRNPQHGFDARAARATVEAAWSAGPAAPGGEPAAARGAFLSAVEEMARDRGHAPAGGGGAPYPTPWRNLAARIRAEAGASGPHPSGGRRP